MVTINILLNPKGGGSPRVKHQAPFFVHSSRSIGARSFQYILIYILI